MGNLIHTVEITHTLTFVLQSQNLRLKYKTVRRHAPMTTQPIQRKSKIYGGLRINEHWVALNINMLSAALTYSTVL